MSWDFGDSTPPSTLQNPTHTYQAGGPYTVTLTSTNINGSDSHTETISAAGCSNGPVRRSGYPDYSWIQVAYGAIGTGETDTIYVQALTLGQTLTFDQDKTVTLKGGYDCLYSDARIPETRISDRITIKGGKVFFDQITIK